MRSFHTNAADYQPSIFCPFVKLEPISEVAQVSTAFAVYSVHKERYAPAPPESERTGDRRPVEFPSYLILCSWREFRWPNWLFRFKMPQTQNLPPPPKLSTQGVAIYQCLSFQLIRVFGAELSENSTVLLHTSCNKFSLLHHIILVALILSPQLNGLLLSILNMSALYLLSAFTLRSTQSMNVGGGGGGNMRHPLTQRRANHY